MKHRKGMLTALIIYVDDMVVTGDDVCRRNSKTTNEEIQRLQMQLSFEFEIKNLGKLKYF